MFIEYVCFYVCIVHYFVFFFLFLFWKKIQSTLPSVTKFTEQKLGEVKVKISIS